MTTKPRPRRKTTHVSVSGPFYERLRDYAIAHNVTMNSVVERSVAPAIGLGEILLRSVRSS